MIDVVLLIGRLLFVALLYLFLFALMKTGIGLVRGQRKKERTWNLSVERGPKELRGVSIVVRGPVIVGRSPGADIVVAHMGLTTGGTIGAETARTLDDCVEIIAGIAMVVKDINPDALVICHGGPISEPKDAAYIIERVAQVDGFFGATSIERLAAERGIRAQTEAFKAIRK